MKGRQDWNKRILGRVKSHTELEVEMNLASVRNSREPMWPEQSRCGRNRGRTAHRGHTCPFLVLHFLPLPEGPARNVER